MSFTIAAAQSVSVKGDVEENVRLHAKLVKHALRLCAEVVVFPELSLTGYEPTIAAATALDADSQRLWPLKQLVEEARVTVIAGCPVRSDDDKPYIGAVILRPGKPTALYRKRFLHADEETHFVPSRDTVVCSTHGCRIGVAICADISHPVHAADARKRNADIYAAGVMMTPQGIDKAEAMMARYAKEHDMLTVLANHGAETGGFPTAGRSAIWSETGQLLAQGPSGGTCLVLAEKTDDGWTGRMVATDANRTR